MTTLEFTGCINFKPTAWVTACVAERAIKIFPGTLLTEVVGMYGY